MAGLEELVHGAAIRGVLPDGIVTVVDVTWYGTAAIELTYKDNRGTVGNQLLYRGDEDRLEVVEKEKPWRFDGDGSLLRLVSEAQRIRLAHLFDPFLAVHTSVIEPYPHQITAVYDVMLPRQPLRFLLADDPGAGKTIMTGLLIKELRIRGDIDRCMIVCPGNLVFQWQEELQSRFNLPFDILTNDRIATARTGNIFNEMPLMIARLDKLARDEKLHTKLDQSDWDLIVCDEAHKMSATLFGGEIKYTKRHRLGQRLSNLTRHFLLLTATPHNGKEEDFQLFMSLLDPDRFEGRYRRGIHKRDVSDLMRRMVKEQLLTFDGRPLFPERHAYTIPYRLSPLESELYHAVTNYVREEFNRADALENKGRKGNVGFALMVLQRRLASSPAAIHESLKRRRGRLESRLNEEEFIARGGIPTIVGGRSFDFLDDEDVEDLDDAPADEIEELEGRLIDQATAAMTIEELRIEIDILRDLEELARQVRRSGTDRKWEELSGLLQNQAEMFDAQGNRRKLVIFTEHKDTLDYLTGRIRSLLGRPEAVVNIHGGMQWRDRQQSQESFTQDKHVQVLVATDAAGEGINLQRAHLMINYDLPWNPNRIEQRFGRIHRIGQTEVCFLWNLTAAETREGAVYQTLLRKLEQEKLTLGGAVFDVIGKAIDGKELRRLMVEAIRYGDQPDVRAKLTQVLEGALDRQRLQELIAEKALSHDMMSAGKVHEIRREMDRLEARRLQPHFIAALFKQAFRHFGGTLRPREEGRFEISRVPAVIRQRDQLIGRGDPIPTRYERVCFEKKYVNVQGKPPSAFLCPGHSLLDATIDLVLERYRDLMKQGSVLLAEEDPGETARALFYLEHTIEDAGSDGDGRKHIVSRRLQFVEIPLSSPSGDITNQTKDAGPAPYLDYRPLTPDEWKLIVPLIEETVNKKDLEQQAIVYAINSIVPRHLEEARQLREPLIDKTAAAVKDRLSKEIAYWDHRAVELKAREQAGHVNARLNSARAQKRADELGARLQRRMYELTRERQLATKPPVAIGGALVIPGGLMARLRGQRRSEPSLFAKETKRVEDVGMAAVMAAERTLGHEPRDVGSENRGYDVESLVDDGAGGRLRFIEVKGRIAGAETVTITRNEILTSFNKPDDWILALVEVSPVEDFPEGDAFTVRETTPINQAGPLPGSKLRYVRRPFDHEPDWEAVSVNYNWRKLWQRGEDPTSFATG